MEAKDDLRRARGVWADDRPYDDSDASDWDGSETTADGVTPTMEVASPDVVAPLLPNVPSKSQSRSAPEIGAPPAGQESSLTAGLGGLVVLSGSHPGVPTKPYAAVKAGTAPALRNSGRALLSALDDGLRGSLAVFKKRGADTETPQIDFRRDKNNSTSSLYIKDTISHPDQPEVQRCVSAALLRHIKAGHTAPEEPDPSSEKRFEIFNEIAHPIEKTASIDLNTLPTQDDVFKFISTVFASQQIPSECSILCLAYVERLLAATKLLLQPWNWRRVVLGTLMIASKVWEDLAVWNVDFQPQFPFLSVADLNTLERHLLQLLDYNVTIKPSEYAAYFLELRSLSKLEDRMFPMKPLSAEDAEQLEQRSLQRYSSRPTSKIKRTKSSEQFFESKSPRGRAVLQ